MEFLILHSSKHAPLQLLLTQINNNMCNEAIGEMSIFGSKQGGPAVRFSHANNLNDIVLVLIICAFTQNLGLPTSLYIIRYVSI